MESPFQRPELVTWMGAGALQPWEVLRDVSVRSRVEQRQRVKCR